MPNNHKTKLLVVICCASFASGLMASSVNVALPDISREFNINAATLPWITLTYILSSTIMMLAGGRLSDIYGRRRIFIYGLIIITAASFVCALSGSEGMLIIFRGCQGIGNALLNSPGSAIVVAAYPANQRGKALGIYLASVYLGLTMGPLIGGVLTGYLGWRSLFFLNIPIGLVCLILLWQMRRIPDEAVYGRFDVTGWLICSAAIFLIMYGLTLVPSWPGIWLFTGGLIGALVFIWWEKRTPIPLLDMDLFKNNRIFIFSNLAALINYGATYGISLLISLYVQYIKGYSPQGAGLILASIPIMESIFSPLAGRWSDRLGSRNLASLGMALSTVGLVMLYFISRETSTLYIVCALVVIGLGLALFVSPNSSAIMSSVASGSYGIASATLSVMRQMGMMLSLGIVTIIFALYIGSSQITAQYYPVFLSGVKLALGIFAVLSFAGIFASYARGSRRNA